MAKIMVFDGNWYLWRAGYTFKSERSLEEALPTAFLNMVLKDAVQVGATHLLIAFDGPKVFRYDIYPQYKQTRRDSKELRKEEDEDFKDVYVCIPHIRKLCEELGIAFVQHKKYEADDYWASAAVQYVKQDHKVIGGCQDKDGYQVLSKNAKMYDASFKPEPRWIDVKKAEKIKGVPISKMIMYQTLLGDKIDDVPQILSPAKAKKVCVDYDSISDWFKKADVETKKWLRSKQAQLVINKELVTLKTDLALPDVDSLKPGKKRLEEVTLSKYNKDALTKWWYAHQDLCWPKAKGLFGSKKK